MPAAPEADAGRQVIAPLQAEGAEHWIFESQCADIRPHLAALSARTCSARRIRFAALTPPTIERLDCEGAA